MAGTERVIVQLARIIGDVVIIVPGEKKIAFSGYDDLNVKSIEIGDFPVAGGLSKITHRVKYYKKINNIFNFNEFDQFVSFSFDLNLINVLLSKKYNSKSIICEHIEYNYHKGLRNKIRKLFYRQKNVKLICLTETDKIKFKNDGIDAYVIPNFINPVTNKEYLGTSKKIISIGRLEYQKNFKFLVQAFAASQVYKYGWVLDIVGEGSEYDSIIDEINFYKLNDFIKIHPVTKEIDRFYKDASLLCMTSRFEALPMVLLEAMNFGLPVLVTDFPTGAKEILGSDNNQISLQYDPKKYGLKLREMCLNVEILKQNSEDNLKLIKYYHPDRIKKLWLSVF
jgi:glycosyltransferase involved in cell wall biosynthesis